MKVVCTRVPPSPNGVVLEASPWVTVGAEYHVVSVLAEPHSQVRVQILTDDGRSLAWFDSTDFLTVDGTVPASWAVRIAEAGVLALGPAAWLVPGFWEAYYDEEPSAVGAVESELRALR